MTDQTTAAVFNPSDFGIRENQWWAEPWREGEDGQRTRDIWFVIAAFPGKVHIKRGPRTKVVCPFVLAFNYEKVVNP